jgi:hypothetical protein
MTNQPYQPYAWPRPDTRKGKDEAKAAVREHKKAKRAQRSADPNVNPVLAVAIIGAAVVGMVVLNVQFYKHAEAQYAWAANAGAVQQVLNDKYVEDIQVIREQVAVGRGYRWVQTFGIDGVVRTDCEVPDDTNPTIECGSPVTLTREGARNRGGNR